MSRHGDCDRVERRANLQSWLVDATPVEWVAKLVGSVRRQGLARATKTESNPTRICCPPRPSTAQKAQGGLSGSVRMLRCCAKTRGNLWRIIHIRHSQALLLLGAKTSDIHRSIDPGSISSPDQGSRVYHPLPAWCFLLLLGCRAGCWKVGQTNVSDSFGRPTPLVPI